MTIPAHPHRDPRRSIGLLIVLAAFAAAAGCSTAETPGGSGTNTNHVLPSGESVAGWLAVPSGGSHASTATLDYISGNGSTGCAECHGSDLRGGISGVSCFANASGCHHGPVAGWVAIAPAVQQHGASAKRAPGSSGFAACQICHGRDYSGGGANTACSNCHVVNAPHPPKPWRSSASYTHTNTATANAPVCAQCHFFGSPNNPLNHPAAPAPAGTPPGCFNNTLCHGESTVPHPTGAAWVATPPAAQPHGNEAKATPSSTAGFDYCHVCHGTGTNFAGGTSGVSCTNNPNAACHGPTVASPHPSQWLPGDNYVHTSTSGGNAAVCAFCHQSAAGTPGCFNNTLCHGAAGAAHAVPFNDNAHYTVDNATFASNCTNCHDVSTPSSKTGPVCRTCHVAASPLAAANCTSCHASPPDNNAPAGAAYPNIAGRHGVHLGLNGFGSPVTCGTCHNGLGSGTLNHYNRAKFRVAPGDAAFTATYNARSGASSFDNSAALSCSNVSCHGGQATPNWRTGAIDVNSQCASCHTVPIPATPQFNGPTSTNHNRPQHQVACSFCHNATALAANHFTNLATPELEGPASATIGGTGTAIISYVPATRTCTPACHGAENW